MRLAAMLLGWALSLVALGVAQALPGTREAQYEALDPRGTWPAIPRIPLAARLSTLQSKRVYLVQSWPNESGLVGVTRDLASALTMRGAEVTIKDRNVHYSEDDPQLWAQMKQKSDAFLYIAAASSSTTSYAFKWSAHLEKSGMPGAVVLLDQLASVARTTNQREGAAVRSVAFSYPAETMDKGRYRAAIDATIAQLTDPLTKEELRTDTVQIAAPPRIVARGSLGQIEQVFYYKGLTDGLPIVPPTESNVQLMLKGTSHAPEELVASSFYPEGLRVTVRQVAISGVMAGCDPQDMPVLLATIEAFQKSNLNSVIRSTNSFAFMQS